MEGDFSLLVWFNQAAEIDSTKIAKASKRKIRQARIYQTKTGK